MPIAAPTIDPAATGANIKALIKSKGLKVTDVQTMFGFNTPQAIFKWLRGDALPSIDNLVILAAVLGVTVDQILVVEGDSSGDGDGAIKSSVTTGISVQW